MRALKAEETSESTANRYMALLRAILKRCVDDWKVLESAPKVPMYAQAEQEPRWLTPQEFSRLEAQLPPHLKAAAQFSVLTGLRMRSMLSLTWDQVDFKKKTAWVSALEMKAGKTLGIPLSIDAVNVLKKQPVVENVPWVFSWRSARCR
jgi:integrase